MDDLQELTNALSNATIYTASPSPRLGVRNPHSNCNLAFRQNCWELHTATHLLSAAKNVAQKNELSGGTSFVGC